MENILYKLFFGKKEYNIATKHTAYQSYTRNLQKIWNNERHHDVGFEKIMRLVLVGIQIIFPGLHIRNYFGKKGVISRTVGNEFYVLFKTTLPLFFLVTGLYEYKIAIAISIYLLTETVFYVSSLIFVSDMFVKPRSYRRNILMLSFNYFEICFSFAVIYGGLHLLNGEATGIIDYIYFSIITSTTIGFGDIHPVLPAAKIVVCLHALLVVSFIVLFLNFFSSKVEIMHDDDVM